MVLTRSKDVKVHSAQSHPPEPPRQGRCHLRAGAPGRTPGRPGAYPKPRAPPGRSALGGRWCCCGHCLPHWRWAERRNVQLLTRAEAWEPRGPPSSRPPVTAPGCCSRPARDPGKGPGRGPPGEKAGGGPQRSRGAPAGRGQGPGARRPAAPRGLRSPTSAPGRRLRPQRAFPAPARPGAAGEGRAAPTHKLAPEERRASGFLGSARAAGQPFLGLRWASPDAGPPPAEPRPRGVLAAAPASQGGPRAPLWKRNSRLPNQGGVRATSARTSGLARRDRDFCLSAGPGRPRAGSLTKGCRPLRSVGQRGACAHRHPRASLFLPPERRCPRSLPWGAPHSPVLCSETCPQAPR